MADQEVKRLKIRELLPEYGDKIATLTLEEAKDLTFDTMITVLPDGKTVRSWDELLEGIHSFHVEELELIRFAPMAGG